ncbi:MAG: hypothetical protein R3F41_14055 [Gammaproteobacteria bacterium]|nr:hypothetical protein [Pseudomonadales bacterium]MCP5349226.1 hypothetical protein [Pseudomonadales bacterium]
MGDPRLVLRVRFKSILPLNEVMQVVESRADEFRARSDLQQKNYLQGRNTAQVAGL